MEAYEAPTITVIGSVATVTQGAKPGIHFDFPGAASDNRYPQPNTGVPGTYTS